ncbi:chymotrypsin-like elastase family member 2A [Amblyraja radiata]|uniref:chymotrypsin-like elastase family member 2A n=1 Tax=Amblyraja radiata TaxID=386614 RepID=UPI001402F673|nr:chymotrypsin-like elastase family member 2A [Amblyraja radiata]
MLLLNYMLFFPQLRTCHFYLKVNDYSGINIHHQVCVEAQHLANMMRFALVALLVTTVYGCGTPTYQPILAKVVGGVDARPHSWPWQISLQISREGRWSHTCGGSLIDPRWVMTAAHCINNKYTYRVGLGKQFLSEDEAGSVYAPVEKLIPHEKFSMIFAANGYDIALVKLAEPVVLNDKVNVGCIPAPGTLLPNNYSCYITGWGLLKAGGTVSNILQQALLPAVDHATCSQPSWWWMMVKESMVCAGGDGLASGCNGDSGGPLNCRNADGMWEVHGVVSFGSSSCSHKNKPTVFTRVSAYNDWINEKMMNN